MEMKTILKKFGFLIGVAFSLIMTVVTVYLIYTKTLNAFEYGKKLGASITEVKPEREMEITLTEETSIEQAAEILEKEGVIDNALIFKLENLLKGNAFTFQSGTYTVNTNMNSNEIIRTLRSVDTLSTDVTITISEGFTVKNIGDYLENKGVVTAEEFIEACNNSNFDYAFIRNIPERENRLEGYLFPDTYFIAENATAEDVIHKMLTRFEDIYNAQYQAQAEQMGLTMDEVMTIASIIEKEIKVAEEREKASSVIHNRLEAQMPLQMCSTILYALDKRKDRLTEEDLKVDSPYNTYQHEGLPVGPISNPGEACIKAALYPEESDLLFFVVKDEETGEHFFTNDHDAFVAAKEQYNQKF